MLKILKKRIRNFFQEESTNTTFEDIKIVNKNYYVKSEMLDFIENQSFMIERADSFMKSITARDIISVFKTLQEKFEKEHNIPKHITLTYFSMDPILFPELAKTLPLGIGTKNYILGNKDIDFITGVSLKHIYADHVEELMEKIETHFNDLPITTTRFINSLKNRNPTKPFKKISNEFEYNVFLTIINKDITVMEITKYYNIFKETEEFMEKFSSIYFLHKALKETVNPHKQDNSFNALKERVETSLLATVENIHKKTLEEKGNRSLANIFLLTKNDITFKERLISHFLKNDKTWKIHYFLFFLTEDAKTIKKIDRLLLNKLNKNSKLAGIDLLISEEKFNKTYLEENKRQFYISHPNYKLD